MTAIAQRAGVSRPTVYSQFPDDRSLFAACSGRCQQASTPCPDLEDGELERTLEALYAYFAENRQMLTNVDRDARLLPALAEVYSAGARVSVRAQPTGTRERIAPGEGRVRAVAKLAFSFSTWQTLRRLLGSRQTRHASLTCCPRSLPLRPLACPRERQD